MATNRRWELLVVLLLTLQSMGDPDRSDLTYIVSSSGGSARRSHKYSATTVNTRIESITHTPVAGPIPQSSPEPETCPDSGKVVLRLSRIGIRVVSNGMVDSSRVTELHLDDNGITKISCGAFDMVPNLETLNVSSNNISIDRLLYFGEHKRLLRLIVDDNKYRNSEQLELKTIYKPLPNLWELSLRRSFVTVFAVSLNNFAPNLGRLSLSGNLIESSEFLKDAPKNLKYLDLSENRISKIPSWLPHSLLELTVAGNKIKELCAENCGESSLSLHKLTNLKMLNASRNAIVTVQADAFQSLTNLIVLDLSGNEIHELPGTLWDWSRHIQELHLAKNKLTSVPKPCKLHYLQRLDLSGNLIPSVPNEHLCEGLGKLQFLFLNDNHILEVDGAAFRKFKALRTLSLCGNMLTTVPSNLITTTSIELLLMRRNHVNTLENLANERGMLRELHLQDNPLFFINTTWINSRNLPHLRIMLKDRWNDQKVDETGTNSDEDDDDDDDLQ